MSARKGSFALHQPEAFNAPMPAVRADDRPADIDL